MNRRQRLLVVDNVAATRASLSDYLDQSGYRARFASSGLEALEVLRKGYRADAIVYDATMPAMGGRAFVRLLRTDGNAAPVLLMTPVPAAETEGSEAVDAVIAKPFRLAEFGDALGRMLARYHA